MDTKALIVALGGNGQVARALGVSSQAISQWISAGAIPAAQQIPLWSLASEAGLDWTPPGAEALRDRLRGPQAAA